MTIPDHIDKGRAEPLHIEPHPASGAKVGDFYELILNTHKLMERTLAELGGIRAEQVRQSAELSAVHGMAEGNSARISKLEAVEAVEERARLQIETARAVKEAREDEAKKAEAAARWQFRGLLVGGGGAVAIALDRLWKWLFP